MRKTRNQATVCVQVEEMIGVIMVRQMYSQTIPLLVYGEFYIIQIGPIVEEIRLDARHLVEV